MSGFKLVSSIILLVVLIIVYVAMITRTRLKIDQPATKVDPLSQLASEDFFAKLRTRDVNGELPVKVDAEQTNKDGNPFGTP